MKRLLTTRWFALVVMLVQLTVMVALPVSHAAAEAAALNHEVHIQAAGDDVCVPHADLTCPTCRLLGNHRLPHVRRPLFDAGSASDDSCKFLGAVELPAPITFQPLGSRAPPLQ